MVINVSKLTTHLNNKKCNTVHFIVFVLWYAFRFNSVNVLAHIVPLCNRRRISYRRHIERYLMIGFWQLPVLLTSQSGSFTVWNMYGIRDSLCCCIHCSVQAIVCYSNYSWINYSKIKVLKGWIACINVMYHLLLLFKSSSIIWIFDMCTLYLCCYARVWLTVSREMLKVE